MILVTGAAGNVGGEVVAQLAAAGQKVRALVRNREVAAPPPGVEVAAGDLNRPESLALAPALRGVRGVFLLGGDRDMPALLAAIARAGVERVVLLSSRSALLNDPSNAIVNMWLASEAAVRASGVPSFTLLRPSGFASNALRWLPQLRAGDRVRAPFADAPIASIDPYDIAAVAVAALTEAGHAAQAYALSGPAAQRPAEQVRILARVLGRDLRFEPQPDDEALADLRSAPPGFADAFYRFFVKGEFDDAVVSPTVKEITGREPRSFEQWARAHAEAFR
jgi:uncharacterized protein YbjT (DUF2867 family)